MMGTDYPENILPDDDGVGFLSGVAPVLAAADVTFGNLEGVLMDGGEAIKRCKPPSNEVAVTQTPVESESEPGLEPVTVSVQRMLEQPVTAGSCYVFRSPTRYANYLREAGFDVMSLANNHAQDFGDPGRDSSMATLDAIGIHHSGREGDIAEWTTQGRRFALVAFAPNVGSHQLNDLARAQEIIKAVAANHDIVIVSFHGGSEGEGASTLPFTHEIYAGEDRGDVVEFAHTAIDAGADLVIGHGPHVLRAVELYRDRLIAYSLGNFATYYGISVTGIRGIAGILTTRLADDGRFMEARLDSTIQIRPAGPTLDPERRAVAQLRDLTTQAFPMGSLRIEDDGRILLTQP